MKLTINKTREGKKKIEGVESINLYNNQDEWIGSITIGKYFDEVYIHTHEKEKMRVVVFGPQNAPEEVTIRTYRAGGKSAIVGEMVASR